VERRSDTFYREHIADPAAHGQGSRANRDGRADAAARRIRLVCRPCRRRIDVIADVDLAYRQHPNRSEFVDGEMVLAASRPWRCRCGRTYRITLERMRIEYRAAVERGDRVISLPLGRL
jgi:hypothetical protein